MEIAIKKDLCIGCGACQGLCPEIFDLNEDGKAYVIEEADLYANLDCAKEAVSLCMAKAIIIEE